MALSDSQIQTFAINGTMALFILIVGSIVLSRNSKSRLNRSFFLFYFMTAFGLIINVAYRLLDISKYEAVVIWMNRATMFFSVFSLVFLLIFNLIIYHSEQVFTRKKSWLYVILWALICSGFIWIDMKNGVQWDFDKANVFIGIQSFVAGQAGAPAWSTGYSMYAMIIGQGFFIFIIVIAVRVILKFEDKRLRWKYISSMVAILFFDWILIGNILNNWVVIQDVFTGAAIPFSRIFLFSSALIVPAVILLWLGVRSRKRE